MWTILINILVCGCGFRFIFKDVSWMLIKITRSNVLKVGANFVLNVHQFTKL